MIAAQRRRAILDELHREGAVSIATIAEQLQASIVTVRRDLDQLETEGALTRTHGGAILHSSVRESSYAEKLGQARPAKVAIARAAAALVQDGDMLGIGPGTTTELFAQQLTTRVGLRIVTNSLLVAEAMVAARDNEVVLVGGTLRHAIRALVGGDAVRQLGQLRFDRVFLSGNGLAADFGLSTPALPVADTDRAMTASAGEVVAIVDHTKVGLRSAVLTVPTARIARLVTDDASPASELSALRATGVDVQVVPAS